MPHAAAILERFHIDLTGRPKIGRRVRWQLPCHDLSGNDDPVDLVNSN